jgi:hypothetical protein
MTLELKLLDKKSLTEKKVPPRRGMAHKEEQTMSDKVVFSAERIRPLCPLGNATFLIRLCWVKMGKRLDNRIHNLMF